MCVELVRLGFMNQKKRIGYSYERGKMTSVAIPEFSASLSGGRSRAFVEVLGWESVCPETLTLGMFSLQVRFFFPTIEFQPKDNSDICG